MKKLILLILSLGVLCFGNDNLEKELSNWFSEEYSNYKNILIYVSKPKRVYNNSQMAALYVDIQILDVIKNRVYIETIVYNQELFVNRTLYEKCLPRIEYKNNKYLIEDTCNLISSGYYRHLLKGYMFKLSNIISNTYNKTYYKQTLRKLEVDFAQF